MSSKKDIGTFYKQELEGYTSTPSDTVWKNIEAELKKKKRRVLPIWHIAIGLGLIILLLSLITLYKSYSNTKDSTGFIKDTKQTNQNENLIKSDSNKTLIDSIKNNSKTFIIPTDSINLKTHTLAPKELNRHKSISNKNNGQIKNKKAFYTNNQTNIKNNSPIAINASIDKRKDKPIKNSFDTTRNANYLNSNTTTNSANKTTKNIKKEKEKEEEEEEEEDKEDKKKKLTTKKKITQKEKPLQLSLYVLPTYFNVLGNKSALDKLLDNNKRMGLFNLNYGVAISTKISQRSSVRIGIGLNRLGYITKDADETRSILEGGFLKYSPGYENLTLKNQSNFLVSSVFEPESSLDFEQRMDYIEIPLDYIYHLKYDSKINIDLSGGLGMLIVSNQSITAVDKNGTRLEIGKAKNLKVINLNLNLGGRLSYPLNNKLHLNLEPRLKYYPKIYSNSINLIPFSIGARFGATYQF